MIARPRLLGALAIASALIGRDASAADRDPWFSTDKTLHFGVSAVVAGGGYAAGTTIFESRGHALVLGGGLAIAGGIGKELLDMAGLGDPSWKDFTWDVIGTFTGLAVTWGIDLLVRGVSHRHPAFARAFGGGLHF